MDSVLQKVVREVIDFYDGIRDIPITPEVTVSEIRRHLKHRYGEFAGPIPLEEVLDDVFSMMRKWMVHNTHPCYYGLFNPSVHLASVVAETLVAAYNPQLAVWRQAPGAQEIERYTLEFFSGKLGFDPKTSFANFTYGGSEANQTAVLAALTHVFPEYGEDGVSSIPSRPMIYLSGECHHSFEKIAHMVGLGRRALRLVNMDEKLKLDPDDLLNKIKEDEDKGRKPFMVVATAGTTGAGVIDPLPELAAIGRDRNLWIHVDAAWAGAACLSEKLKSSIQGIDAADSITWDAHKWLSVPMAAGMFFCRHRETVARTFGVRTSYMPDATEDTFDPYVNTIQWSRRLLGLRVFMTLAELGAEGYREEIEKQAEMGDALRAGLKERGWRIVNDTPLPVVCFTHERIESGAVTTAEILKKIYARKKCWISDVVLGGRTRALRACVTSYRTEKRDIDLLIREVEEAFSSCSPA